MFKNDTIAEGKHAANRMGESDKFREREGAMPETELTIPSGGISLEARWDEGAGSEVVVISHPHPLYGGNMDNNVVWTLKKTLRASGWGTLRFNSRGVGESGGSYGDGDGETEDLLAAAGFLIGQGDKILHLAGYSYGAWISLKAVLKGIQPASLILVSPPLDFIGFDNLSLPQVPCLITLGSKDEFCSVPSLEKWLGRQHAAEHLLNVEIIPRCDHFYWGWEGALASMVEHFLKKHFLQ